MKQPFLCGFSGLSIAAVLVLSSFAAAAPQAETTTTPEMTREHRIQWWREARFGMFIHWGLYAIPGGTWKGKVRDSGYSEWLMFDEKIPAKEYEQLAAKFNPVKFNAAEWSAIAKKAGMKYMVLTAKHHDGFSMFQSEHTPYDIVDATPFKRDITGELSKACRDHGLRFGCYYSVDRDWYRPQGPGNRYKQTNTWDYPNSTQEDFDRYLAGFAQPQVEEILKKYRPDVLWFDDIDMKNEAQVLDLYRAVRSLRPECVINSRIRGCVPPKTMPPPFCDYLSSGDNEILKNTIGFEWENPGSMNTSYGYNPNDHQWHSADEIITKLIQIVSKGGNYLLNVGPTPEGKIPGPCIERLAEVGRWMDINGDAIYGSMPWLTNEEKIEASGLAINFTTRGDAVYVFCPVTGKAGDLAIKALGERQLAGQGIASVTMLGSENVVNWSQSAETLSLALPAQAPVGPVATFRVLLRR
ncbi:MAG: alpha-L-fucosidase [Verrucomicrobiales bacterium]